ncbi:GDSL-type esterase/lipase family protein [Mycoplasma hafezii]|uniref:GDSL-type esterase/lipase family protein n=1 Tax=Mycoplasma hafezii TaxID=525886 RepID=UPI003CF5DD0E
MKKRNNAMLILLGAIGTVAFSSSCSAPGSSKAIETGDGGVVLSNDWNKVSTEKVPTDVTSSTRDQESNTGDKINQPILDAKIEKDPSEHLIKLEQKVNYVALGDSMTAGFDGSLPQDYPGELKNKNVTGASYPAFFARILNNKDRLEAFKNYAVSGATTLDWIEFLGIKTDYKKQQANILNQILGNQKVTPEEVKQALEKANLVTFTLGANDFFFLTIDAIRKSNLFDILETLDTENPSYAQFGVLISKIYQQVAPEVKKRLATFISNLKVLAPNANINLIGYPTPFLGLKQLLDQAFSGVLGENAKISISDQIIQMLNDNLSEVASKYDVNYVNLYNPTYWDEHTKELSSVFFDIHPNTTAYKKMGLDLFLKLAVPNFKLDSYDGFDFTQDYLNSDKPTLKYQIEISGDPAWYTGWNTQMFLDNKTQFENDLNLVRTGNNYSKRLEEFIRHFQHVAVNVLDYILENPILQKLDPDGRLRTFLSSTYSGISVADRFIDNLLNTNIFQTIVDKLQQNLQYLAKENKLTIPNVAQAFKDAIMDDNYLFDFINALASSDFINIDKPRVSEILENILVNAALNYKEDAINFVVENYATDVFLATGITNFEFKKMLEDILATDGSQFTNLNVNELVKVLVDTFINHSNNFTTVRNWKEFFDAFLLDSENPFEYKPNTELINKLANGSQKWVQVVLSNDKIKDLIANYLAQYLQDKNLISPKRKMELVNIINKILTNASAPEEVAFIQNIAKDFISEFLTQFIATRNSDLPKLAGSVAKTVFGKHFKDKQSILDLIKFFSRVSFQGQTPAQTSATKEIVKEIVSNLLKSKELDLSRILVDQLKANYQDVLDQYLGRDNFENLLNIVMQNPNLVSAFNNVLFQVIDKLDEIAKEVQGANSIEDVVKIALSKIDWAKVKPEVVSLIDSVMNEPSFKAAAQKIFSRFFDSLNLSVPVQDQQALASDLANLLGDLLQKLDLWEPIVDSVFDTLSAASKEPSSEAYFNKLSQIPQDILTVIKNKYQNNYLTLIKNVLDSKLFKNNTAAWAELLAALFNKIANTNEFNDFLIKSIHPFLAAQEQYIDVPEVEQIINNILGSLQVKNFVAQALQELIKNTSWINQINQNSTPTDILNVFWNNKAIKELFVKNIEPALVEQLQDGRYLNTLLKVLNIVAKNNGVDLDLANNEVIARDLLTQALEFLKTNKDTDQLINLLINQLNSSQNLNDFNNSVVDSLLAWVKNIDFVKLTNTLINTYANAQTAKQDKVITYLQNILAQLLKHKQLPTWVDGIDFSKFVGANNNQITKDLALAILKSDQFNTISANLVKLIVKENVQIDASNWENTLLRILKNEEFWTNVAKPLTSLADQYVLDQSNIPLLAELLTQLLFTNEQTKAFVESEPQANVKAILEQTLNSIWYLKDDLDLSSSLINTVVAFAKDKELNTLTDLANLTLANIKAKVKAIDLQTESLKLIEKFFQNAKKLSSSEFDTVKHLANKLINYAISKLDQNAVNGLIKLIPANVMKEIENYVSVTDLTKVASVILSDQNLHNFIDEGMNNLITNITNASDIKLNSFNDLLKLVMTNLNWANINSNIKSFVTSLLSNTDVQNILANTLVKAVKQVEPDFINGNEAVVTNFATSLSQNLLTIINQFDVFDLLINKTTDFLDQANTASDPLAKLAEYPAYLLVELKDLVLTNDALDLAKISSLINKFLDTPVFNQNQDFFKYLITYVLNKPEVISLLEQQVSTALGNYYDQDKTIQAYATKSDLLGLVEQSFKSEHFNLLIKNLLNKLIDNPSLIKEVFNNGSLELNSTTFKLFKDLGFYAENKNTIVNLVLELLAKDTLHDSLTKSAQKLLADNNLITQDLPSTFGADLRNSLVTLLKSNPSNILINQLKDKLVEVLNDSSVATWNDLAAKLPSVIISILDLQDYQTVKIVLNLPIWNATNADVLSVITTNAFNNYLTKDFVQNQLQNADFSAINPQLQVINWNDQKLKNFLIKELNKDTTRELALSLAKQLVADLTTQNNLLAKANSYSELIKAIFNNKEVVNELKPYITALVKDLLDDADTQNGLASELAKVFAKDELKPYFANIPNSELLSLAKNVISLYSELDPILNISEVLFDTVSNQLKNNGLELDFASVTKSLVQSLKDKFQDPNTLENNIVKIIQAVANANIFKQNKTTLLTIINNVYKLLATKDSATELINQLPANTLDKITKYIPKDKFAEFVGEIISANEFKDVFVATLENVITHSEEYANISSINDALKITLNNLDFATLEDKIIKLINLVIKNDNAISLIETVLTQTLQTYQVNVTAPERVEFIKGVASDTANFITHFSFLNEIIGTIFSDLKTANNNNTDLLSVFNNVPSIIKNTIEKHYQNNLLSFLNQIYTFDTFRNNQDTFKAVILELVKGLHQAPESSESQLIKWISDPINAIDSEFLDNSAKELLIASISDLLNDDSTYELLDPVITRLLLENNLSYLDQNSDPYLLAKYLLDNQQLNEKLQAKLKDFLAVALDTAKNPNAIKLFTNVIFKTLNYFNLDQDLVTFEAKEQIIQNVLENANEFIQNSKLYDALFNTVLNTIKQNDTAEEFTNHIGNNIINDLDLANNFELIQKLIQASKSVFANKDHWIFFSKTLIRNFISNDTQLDSLINAIDLSTTLGQFNIENNDFKAALKTLIKDSATQDVINTLVEHFFNDINEFTSASSYNELLKAFFSNETFKNDLTVAVRKLLVNLNDEQLINTLIGKFIYYGIQNSNVNVLLNGIDENDGIKLFSSSLSILNLVDQKLNLNQDLIKAALDELTKNGADFDANSLVDPVITSLKTYFSDNLEAKLLDLLQSLFKETNVIDENKYALSELIKNICNYFVHNFDFGSMVWNQIPVETQNFILNNFVDNSNNEGVNIFKNIINEFVQVDQLSDLVASFSSYVLNAKDDILQAASLKDIMVKFFSDEARKTEFESNLKTFILGAIKTKSFKINAEYVILTFFEFLGVNTTPEVRDYVNVLANNIGDGIDRLGLLDNLVNSIVNIVQQPALSASETIAQIKDNLLTSMQITNYDTFKKVLTDELIVGASNPNGTPISHKVVVKQILLDIINKLISQKDKITQVIKDVNLAKLIFGQDDPEGFEIVNNSIIKILNNEKLKHIFSLIISDFLDNSEAYNQKTSWYGALNLLLSANQSDYINSLKENLRGWLVDIFSVDVSHDFFRGLARIVIDKLNASGMTLNSKTDDALVANVLEGFMKTIVTSSEFTTIYNNIYANIQNTNFEAEADPSAKFFEMIIHGALSIITQDNAPYNISLDKLLDKQAILQSVLTNIGDQNYVEFINRLFDASSYGYISTNNGNNGEFLSDETTGIYKAIEYVVTNDSQSKYTVKFDVNIFKVVSKAENFFKIFFTPIYRELFRKVTSDEYDASYKVNYKLTDEYKAMYRFYATMMWMLGSQLGYNSSTFWNGFGIDVQAIINKGALMAFDQAHAETPKFDAYLKEWQKTLGATWRGWYNDEFIQGNRSSSTSNKNYWADQLLAYVYYYKDTKDRHSNRTKAEVLLESLKNGYLKSYK